MQWNWIWRLRSRALAAVIGWAWAAAVVAAPLSISNSGTLSNVDGGAISLSRFDPSLGTLRSVEVEASFKGSKAIVFSVFCRQGPCTSVEDVSLSASAFVSLGDLELLVEQSAQRTVTCSSAGGLSVCSAPDLLLDDSGSTLSTDPATLGLFTGPGTFDVVFTVVEGSRGFVSSFEGQATATYNYDTIPRTVPEPTSLALASTVLLLMVSGLMPRLRRRR